MDSTAGRIISTQSRLEEQQIFIDRFRELSLLDRDPGITLTNIYKEIPISYPATICEIRGHHVELQTCALQLAAISQCSEVYLQSPLIDIPVLGQLDRIDMRHNTVQLSNFSYQELHINKRNTLRVRFKRPISIIANAGPNKISGVIRDISIGGCCLNTLVRLGLDNTRNITVTLKLMEEETGQGLCMQIPSEVVRLTGESSPFMCALRFNHTPQSEQLLSIYINQRQLEILKELRESM